MLRQRLKQIIEDGDNKAGRAFDVVIQALILVSIVTYSLETLPDLQPSTIQVLNGIETFCVVVFTVEYLVRLFVADRKRRFVFSFFGIIDLLAILPFYFGLSADMRSLRAVRLFRLFRVLKMVRYSRAIQRMRVALMIAREEIVLFFGTTAMLLFFAAAGIYHFEHEVQPEAFTSVFDGLWWAVATLTTVGYGDVYPVTVGGRAFTMLVLFVGLGIVAVPAGLVASALSKAREIEDTPPEAFAAKFDWK